jgi:magnesium transporter
MRELHAASRWESFCVILLRPLRRKHRGFDLPRLAWLIAEGLWVGPGWYPMNTARWVLVALTVGLALVGIVAFGSLAGSMLPFLLKRVGFDPASASAPFVATLVDVSGLVIYFTTATLILSGTLL